MLVVVLDYGSGNVRSVVRAMQRVSAELSPSDPARVELSSEAARAIAADALIVPGVGAFAACMAGLDAIGAPEILAKRLAEGRPTLGICVGMQVLFDAGVEHGVRSTGLGLLPGEVSAVRAPVVPHMGWNTVTPAAESVLFAGLPEDSRFYFVHSYAVHETEPEDARGNPLRWTMTEHGQPFAAAVESPLLSATQFHPEKSGAAGQALLANWLRGPLLAAQT